MRFLFRRVSFVAALAVVLVSLGALPAAARPPGTNGQITFGRFNPALGDTQVYVVNPDGTGQRLVQGPTDVGEVPRWFPDGAHIATGGSPALPGGGSRIINPDDGTFRDVGGQDAGLFNPCGMPSPDGTLLLCETFSETGARTESTRSARRTAVASRRSPPTPAATTYPATGRRTGNGSSSIASGRTETPRACSW